MSNKSKVIQNHHARAQERIDNRSSFIGRNVAIWVFVFWVLSPIGASISALTEGFYIFDLLGETNFYLKWIIVAICCIMIEGSVFMMGAGVIDDLQAGALSGTGGEKFLLVIKAMMFLGAFSSSVFCSLNGGPAFQEWRMETATPVTALLIDEATADELYAEDKNAQVAVVNSARNTTWKGNMTRDAVKAMRSANAELKTINAQIEAEKVRIRERNIITRHKYDAEMQEKTSRAFGLTGVGQFIVLFCVVFIGAFNQEVERALGGTKGEAAGTAFASPAPSRPIGFGVAHGSDPTAGRKQIGFKTYGPSPTPSQGTPPATLPAPPAPEADISKPAEGGDGHSVATRGDSRSDAKPDGLEATSRLNSWRTYKRNLATVAKRKTTSANEHAERIREAMAYEESQLAELGLCIEFQESPRRAYILVPLA